MLWAYPPSCRLPLRRHAPYMVALVAGIAERHEASFITAPIAPTSQIAFQLNLSGYAFASWIGRGLWGRILTCSSIRAASLLSKTATPESLTSTTRRMWGRAETQRMFRLLREWDEFYPLGEVLLYLAGENPPSFSASSSIILYLAFSDTISCGMTPRAVSRRKKFQE